MPKKPINYSKAVIYKICCKNPDVTDVYVGSTTEFSKRKNGHKTACNNKNSKKHNLHVYNFIRDNGCWDNWEMIEIEKYQATDRLDLLKRERYWLEQLHATLNSNVPSRTNKQYKQDNREKILKQNKQYKQDNREKILKQKKQYYEDNKEKIKQYREDNREKILKQKKQYYEDKKEKITQRRAQKITCDCGMIISRSSKSDHLKTKKHKDIIEALQKV